MIIRLAVAVVVFFFQSFSAVGTDEGSIPWNPSRKLTWEDFKSRPDENASNAALTSSRIGFKYSYNSEKGFNYNISCLFDKYSSWGRVKTDYILAHEQGHFDIAEIYARKLNKLLKGYNFNPATAQKEVPAMYERIMKEMSATQNEYDDGSDYSRNREGQSHWAEKIRKQLEDLKAFAGYNS